MLETAIYGILLGLILFSVWGSVFGSLLLVWVLAQNDLFFTVLKEGYTKAIMANGKPVRFVMRSEHHRFRRDLGDKRGHPWDILPYRQPPSPSSPSRIGRAWARFKRGFRLVSGVYLLENLVWVGFPPTSQVYSYSFHWSSRIQNPNGEGMKQEQRSEDVAHILAPQQEVYFALIEDAKTRELIPVNASVALTIQIVNPFKALFRTHQWLKTVINQIEPEIREVIGRYTFRQLTESHESVSNELENDAGFKERGKALKQEYGVKIVLSQFRSIEPSGKHADEITKTSLQVYTAEQRVRVAEQEVEIAKQKAKEIDILADATERRLRKELGAVKELGHEAVELRKMELLPKGLQVLGNAPVMASLSPSPMSKNE